MQNLYDEVYKTFKWRVHERFNMDVAVCDEILLLL